jgi:hypothetical protein
MKIYIYIYIYMYSFFKKISDTPILTALIKFLKQIFRESRTLSRLIKKIIPRKQCTSAKHRLFFSFSFFPNQIPLKKIQNTRTQQQPQLQPFIHQRKEE